MRFTDERALELARKATVEYVAVVLKNGTQDEVLQALGDGGHYGGVSARWEVQGELFDQLAEMVGAEHWQEEAWDELRDQIQEAGGVDYMAEIVALMLAPHRSEARSPAWQGLATEVVLLNPLMVFLAGPDEELVQITTIGTGDGCGFYAFTTERDDEGFRRIELTDLASVAAHNSLVQTFWHHVRATWIAAYGEGTISEVTA